MNTPPFKVGQKVVALKDSKYGYFKKGVHYVVNGVKKCQCGMDLISIGSDRGDWYSQVCSVCKHLISINNDDAFHGARFFAPIEESRTRISYVAVSESLRQTAVEIAAVETN